jgi:hypothetical protein
MPSAYKFIRMAILSSMSTDNKGPFIHVHLSPTSFRLFCVEGLSQIKKKKKSRLRGEVLANKVHPINC